METRSTVSIVLRPDFSAVRNDNRAAYRQTEPHAPFARGKEGIENSTQVFRRYAGPLVLNGHTNSFTLSECRTQHQGSLCLCGVGHCGGRSEEHTSELQSRV